MREKSSNGWYRWVGPEPILKVNIPLNITQTEKWLFTITFHAFLNDSDTKSITFKVNEKNKPLEWIRGSTYQSKISSEELYGSVNPSNYELASLSIAVPRARQVSAQDKRILAFAISKLTLIPA